MEESAFCTYETMYKKIPSDCLEQVEKRLSYL